MGKTQERCDVSGMSFQRICWRQVAHSSRLAQISSFLLVSARLCQRTTPSKPGAVAGIPQKAAARSLSSCCLQVGSSVPTLVSLQTFSWCVVRLLQTETLSPDALNTVPSSLSLHQGRSVAPAPADGSSRSRSGESRALLLSPVQGEGFALILLLSDRLSHTKINTADFTVCLCLKNLYLGANVAGCHHAVRNVVEKEIGKI